jgi:hypothetical protein
VSRARINASFPRSEPRVQCSCDPRVAEERLRLVSGSCWKMSRSGFCAPQHCHEDTLLTLKRMERMGGREHVYRIAPIRYS